MGVSPSRRQQTPECPGDPCETRTGAELSPPWLPRGDVTPGRPSQHSINQSSCTFITGCCTCSLSSRVVNGASSFCAHIVASTNSWRKLSLFIPKIRLYPQAALVTHFNKLPPFLLPSYMRYSTATTLSTNTVFVHSRVNTYM